MGPQTYPQPERFKPGKPRALIGKTPGPLIKDSEKTATKWALGPQKERNPLTPGMGMGKKQRGLNK